MVAYLTVLFFMSLIFKDTNPITNGRQVIGEKRYMVYLLQDRNATIKYSGWLCGGVIIHHWYILTAASCLFTAGRVWVISGYSEYVSADKMHEDECIKQKKRRIIHHCSPETFNPSKLLGSYNGYWCYGDVAIAQVDKPFKFHDLSYYNVCSYPPAPIRVNLQEKFLEGGREVIALGWGHREFYRPVVYENDLNQKFLRYGSGRILSYQECKDTYFEGIYKFYKKNHYYFYVCVDKPGHLDENGVYYRNKEDDVYANCYDHQVNRMGNMTEMECIKNAALRDGITDINATTGGICQNDHGGPLVAWIGGVETLIGVASVFTVTPEMRCHGPYMFVSTVCFNRVIACYLETDMGRSRRSASCQKTLSEKVNIVNINVSSFESDTSWDEDDISQDKED